MVLGWGLAFALAVRVVAEWGCDLREEKFEVELCLQLGLAQVVQGKDSAYFGQFDHLVLGYKRLLVWDQVGAVWDPLINLLSF